MLQRCVAHENRNELSIYTMNEYNYVLLYESIKFATNFTFELAKNRRNFRYIFANSNATLIFECIRLLLRPV